MSTTLDERTARVAAAVRSAEASFAVLSGYDAVFYATGMLVSQELGVPFVAGGPDLAVVSPEGETWLVVPRMRAGAARASRADHVVEYGDDTLGALAPATAYAAAVRGLLDGAPGEALGGAGRVLVQPDSLTAPVAELLRERAHRLVDATDALRTARKVKTAEELAALRRCAGLTSAAQRRAREVALPGRTELEAFADVRAVWDGDVGHRCEVTGDFVSGVERTAAVVGWATDRVLREGDPVIADLAPRLDGYWGDSAATFVLGEPTARLRAMHAAVRGALDAGLTALRPGVTAGALDDVVRAALARDGYAYPHHTGHSVGAASHEFPTIAPGVDVPLEEGMVVLLEPGAYDPEVGGVRLEWMVRVGADGAEVMSDFALDL
ncbi:M24 family metallopeptidase [Puerhibacterium puerhi]|uniref:M24 family metallopeptidase n=1 Tax=Puerhibacterium puerhi TaxID=2692623 RepID=UPI001357284B|nr:Xaa-Pro peptidase family protein [Puerhibacterium puerhi]